MFAHFAPLQICYMVDTRLKGRFLLFIEIFNSFDSNFNRHLMYNLVICDIIVSLFASLL